MTDFKGDIPYKTALAAWRGMSFSPEKRAQQEIDGYQNTLSADYQGLLEQADTDEKLKTLEAEFGRYRDGYRKRTISWLNSMSRCVSPMISGPANFPVHQQEKRQNTQHKRLEELIEYRTKALAKINRKLTPELAPIMSGDDDAVERLSEKIKEAERLQATMKEVNRIVRRKPNREVTDEKIAELLAIGFTEEQSRNLFVPNLPGSFGFPDYKLRNNNANIRRMKQRLKSISVAKSRPATKKKNNDITMEDCPADNRVRLVFPGKPSPEVRRNLKSAGFRWAPSLGCWQAYRNHRSIAVANEMVD